MYILDEQTKRLKKADVCTFKELGFKERQDLQEWIANEPSSLGEDLLIIQKEFDGFKETRERLDLLALDKKGRLVVIENKLDDSGRDVTWQAIKYASYCSSLNKQEVLKIYQDYLNQYESGKNAMEKLAEFLEKDYEDVEINKDNSQRIFLVAANFHKEVTSSVLWLQNFNLDIKCFKVTPYRYNNRVLVDFDQIIPIKEAEDYQIKMASKKQEEVEQTKALAARFDARYRFWNGLIEYNKIHNGPYAEAKCTSDNWMGKGLGRFIPGATVNVVIGQNNCRTELYLNNGTQEKNKEVFDLLMSKRPEANTLLPGLIWDRMNEKVTCRIHVDRDFGYRDEENFEEAYAFLSETTDKMIRIFSEIGKMIKFVK